MCGRFALFSPEEILAALFGVEGAGFPPPSYNIAPSRAVAAVRAVPEAPARRELALLRWGLVPSWAKDPAIGNRMINARAETAPGKPSFRSAFRRRRCLVPADGFYEWRKTGGRKQPYYVRMADGKPFAIAGLWERWEGADGDIESCVLLTTGPNDLLAPIHDRMPVILSPAGYGPWLDPEGHDPAALLPLLRPFPPDGMVAFPVRTLVNNPAADDPRCIEPAA
ncbi:MAG: SOS response-associated peptidase [Gemmatimonadota bacterium]